MLGKRPRQPRDPDQPGVGGDEQDRRREDAHVIPQHMGRARAQAQVLDDPQDRVVLKSMRRRLSQQRVRVDAVPDDGQR